MYLCMQAALESAASISTESLHLIDQSDVTSKADWDKVVVAANKAAATIPRLKACAEATAALRQAIARRDLGALKAAIRLGDGIDRGGGGDGIDWSVLDTVLTDAKKRANVRGGVGGGSVSRGGTPAKVGGSGGGGEGHGTFVLYQYDEIS